MNMGKDTAVTLSYVVSNAQGQIVDRGTMAYLHGGYDKLFPKVEAALEGKARGDSVSVALAVEEAFGARDESLVRVIPKSDFPPGVKVGGALEGVNDAGLPQLYYVKKIKGPQVFLDGNHPLAGQALHFKASVQAVRAATAEEIAHRHVHGEHGHHH